MYILYMCEYICVYRIYVCVCIQYMYMCLYVDVHIYVYIMYEYIYYVCIYICVCLYMYVCISMCAYACVHTYACVICMCVYICMCHMHVCIHMHMYAHVCTSSWGDISGLTCTLAILVRLHQHNSVSTDTDFSHFIEFTLATSLLERTTMKHLSIMNLVSNYLTQFLHPANVY